MSNTSTDYSSVASNSPVPTDSHRRPLASLSCVIPCLDEQANLDVLLPVLMAVLKHQVPVYEIIVVDDGSTDGTASSLAHWIAKYPQIIHLQLSRNFGKECALTAGLELAQGQVVVSMDADLQHPPALIVEMLDRWRAGIEMVYAVRTTRADETVFKRWGTRLFYKMMRTSSGLKVPQNAGDFRLMDRVVVDALLMLPERSRFMKGLFAWVGFRTEPIYYSPPERLHGTTRFRPLRLLVFAVDGITSFTTWPLRILSLAGLCVSLLSFVYGMIIIVSHLLYGDQVQGWTTLITVTLFFAGVNLLSLGVVGEYVSRIFSEVKNRPLYLVSKRSGQGLSAQKPKNEHADSDMPAQPSITE